MQAGNENNRKLPAKGKQQVPLDVVALMKYFLGSDARIETGILCPPGHIQFVTTDAALYQAVGSLKPYDNVPLNKITKLLEVTLIAPEPKRTLTHERVDKLRAMALKDSMGQIEKEKQ